MTHLQAVFDAAARAAAYCFLPRVVLLSLLPLLLAGSLTFALGWFFWDTALHAVRGFMASFELLDMMLRWIEDLAGANIKALLIPLVVLFLALPLVVMLSLLLVAFIITPQATRLVVARRFVGLEARRGATWWQATLRGLMSTLVAIFALVLSIPLWLIPPLFLLLPPLIWGWLTYRVLSFDVLAEHASAQEWRAVISLHRWPLLGMGIVAGYLGAAPSVLWAAGAATVMFAPLMLPLAVWLYTLVFVFSALWFAHYGLAALAALRLQGNEA